MKLRRPVIFTDLKRPRLGLSEQDVQRAQRPRTGLILIAGLSGLAPVHRDALRAGETAGGRDQEVDS